MTKKLSALMSKMHVYYNNANNLQTLDELQAGGFYAVKHSDDSWYRYARRYVVNGEDHGVMGRKEIDLRDCKSRNVNMGVQLR